MRKKREPNVYLRDHRGWNLQHHQIAPLLGMTVPGNSWPAEGVPPTVIGNVKVWVTPPNGGKHRVLCECPDCGSTIPAGRLHQHVDTVRCQNAAWRRGVFKPDWTPPPELDETKMVSELFLYEVQVLDWDHQGAVDLARKIEDESPRHRKMVKVFHCHVKDDVVISRTPVEFDR